MGEDLEKIKNKIKETLKLNKYETNAYFTLLKLGKSRPTDIAKNSNIPIQRIYDVLKSLEKKGLITTKDQIYYEILEPSLSFQTIAQNLIADANIKAREIENIGQFLSGITTIKTIDEIKIIYGVKETIGNTITYVKNCNEKPYFMVYKVLDKLLDLWPLLYEIISTTKNGAYLLLPYDAKIGEKYIEESKKHNFEIIKSRAVFMDLYVGCKTVIIGLPSKIYEVISIVINNEEFSNALKERMREIINKF
ncbi:putative transcriptional regulator [Caldisphaera lagunensis DSM 15908]|uniref:Putative transcriptional regulator n=1 Tax=Caldisphaera lagunensis (strain DSM 15908 / JCM 11604 / ANMR 0165 / IC-154) TaxID=1056495 RepID=L0AAK6_CALLD|nr:TrmB family transcriptional regulator [Caldisphaera lagunensis]AFZ70127.1 putative transcriptional regulator [Caldisphaera lagunensis DSM 15908]